VNLQYGVIILSSNVRNKTSSDAVSLSRTINTSSMLLEKNKFLVLVVIAIVSFVSESELHVRINVNYINLSESIRILNSMSITRTTARSCQQSSLLQKKNKSTLIE